MFFGKKKVSSEELGQGLWMFCKKFSKGFYDNFKPIAEEHGFVFDDSNIIDFTRELIIVNLWIISKTLRNDNKALDALHKIYINGHANFAVTEDKKTAFRREAQKELHERYKKYYDAWDDKAGGIQSGLAITMLEYILNEGKPDSRLINAELSFLLITNVLSIMKAVLSFRKGYEVTDQ